MVRNSLKFVSYKDRKALCADLRQVYMAPTEEAGLEALKTFGQKWDGKYPAIYEAWSAKWGDLNEFFKYAPEIRKVIYTTNAIESLNFQLRKVTNNHLTFPTDDAIMKVLYLAITGAEKKWTMPLRNWGAVLSQLRIEFGPERVPLLGVN